jgi:diphosphomevalonate decarboxylase
MQWFAQAPANIALIKYMGKKDSEHNIPTNPSLSYTLNNLLSSVVVETHSAKKDFWEPLDTPGAPPFALSSQGQERFLRHLARIKDYFQVTSLYAQQTISRTVVAWQVLHQVSQHLPSVPYSLSVN